MSDNLEGLFRKFIRERKYIQNLSPRTLSYSQACFDSLRAQIKKVHGVEVGNLNPVDLTGEMFETYVIALSEAGVKPVSIDSYIRGLNCFLSWLERNSHLPGRLRITRPRVEDELPRTLAKPDITALLQLKPRSHTAKRVHAIALVCLDAGCRVKEVLGLRFGDIDLDEMVLRVLGKGRRERLVPFSPVLRRVLVRWIDALDRGSSVSELVFATRDGLPLRYDNMRRDYQRLLKQTGIKNPGSFHRLRHTFATEAIRAGTGEIRLSRILGHSTLDMTKRYVRSNVDDLRGFSPLSRQRATFDLRRTS